MGISVTPRYKTVGKGTTVGFTVSGRGDRPSDYHITLEIEGVNRIDRWFVGPRAVEHSVSYTFNHLGVIPTVAKLTEYPIMYEEKREGAITVTEKPPLPPLPNIGKVVAIALAALIAVGILKSFTK